MKHIDFKAILLLFCALCLCSCAGIRPRYHQVRKGDTLERIAKRYRVPLRALASFNEDEIDDGLRPGIKLYIPFEERSDWNQQFYTSHAHYRSGVVPVRLDAAKFHWPIFGPISSGFGKRGGGFHEGIDIPARRGTAVKAARSGHVIYAGDVISGYGKMVIIRHADTYSTVYAHLSDMNAHKGQFVAKGNRIGKVGSTGRSTSPHLHFEIRNGQIAVNPLFYLQSQYAHNILSR